MQTDWAANVLQSYMGLRNGERVLILVDEPLREAGAALCAAGTAPGGTAPGGTAPRPAGGGGPHPQPGPVLGPGGAALWVVPRPRPLAVVPDSFLRQVSAADVIIALFSGLDLERESPLLRAGLAAFRAAGRGRWGAGACLTPDLLSQAFAADAVAIARETATVAARLAEATRVRITTPAGTDLTFRLGGRPVHQDPGQLHTPGAFGNLPGGEAYVAPLETTGEGRVVIDLSLGDIPLDRPVVLEFRGGRAIVSEGGQAARELQRRLGDDPAAWMLAEFGVGTNPGVPICHRAPLDEKVMGTTHIALGSNTHFGGANAAATHYDCVIADPHIALD